ncbi:hypothetical protein PAPYR_11990 [Paratrimastix pyriformis]|uniref:Uncharacterized protein n=1 Tax=Paratrimastix pyriformis TaxID=342808 RepID=A0ABQ8U861_9EUKA|nr:hypothetical protein PAPYR_11990 [Paratrimastix pyriformis]
MVLETLFPRIFAFAPLVSATHSLVRFCDVCTHCYYCYGYRYGYGAPAALATLLRRGPSGAGSHCAGSTDAWQRPGLAQGRSVLVSKKSPLPFAVGPEDLPSDEAKDLADAGAEFNDAAMNDGEPLPGELPEEGGDELPAPEEQDVVSADDLDLFAPKCLPSVMLASAPKGIDDTTDMFSREDLAALEKSVSGAQATRTAPTLAQATRPAAASASSSTRPMELNVASGLVSCCCWILEKPQRVPPNTPVLISS